MEKTLKNYEILPIANTLAEFMQVELPVKVGWNLKKNLTHIQNSLKQVGEFENELVSKYGVKVNDQIKYDENGQPKIYPANVEVFNKEHTELMNCESTIDILTIKLSDILDKNIKPSLLFNLDFMIEDDIEVNDNNESE